MDTLPISTLPTPPAPSAGENAADAATNAQADSGFQDVLSRSVAGAAQAADAGAAAPEAPEDDGPATADEAALAALAEGLPSASESALALLAALPQQAARPEIAPAGANAGGATGKGIDIGAARDAATPGSRPDDATMSGKVIAPPRPGEADALRAADPERMGELARTSAESIADLMAAGQHQTTHAAAHAAYSQPAPLAADPAAAGPVSVAQPRIETHLGAPGWSTALADQLVMFAGEKQQIAELHINPPHLGPVDITLVVNDDQASAVFASPHAIVRETIESALPRLREVLAESGINLGQASVTADSPRDGSAQAQARASFSGGGERSGAGDANMGTAALAAAQRARGLVDLFA